MQSLATFFEDNKLLASAAGVAAVLVLLIVVFVLYRLLFGRRLRASGSGRARQPRLGIVDAYDLDRQRQLVLVRRDNVEHLIMIGGPTDVVIETAIVRTQSASLPRDKDGTGPLLGTVTAPSATLAPASQQVALPASGPSLPPMPARAEQPMRAEPPMAARGDGAGPVRGEPSSAGRTEPSLGSLAPMPSPAVERGPAGRVGEGRPVAVPDPAAVGQGSQAEPIRPAPPRPSTPPPRPASPPSAVNPPGPAPMPSPAMASPERPAPQRPPLPPRPPVPRPPLPPRPSLASSLPPRPTRPPTPRPEPARPASEGAADLAPTPPATVAEPDGFPSERAPEPAVVRAEPAAPALPPAKSIESLESLEEEMAKLLGRPAPRRDS